jgi:hypothetical protein
VPVLSLEVDFKYPNPMTIYPIPTPAQRGPYRGIVTLRKERLEAQKMRNATTLAADYLKNTSTTKAINNR